ncbi:MAG: hypothetical protein SF182_30620 [Deltaproteobacteria bacterium]|nr:hypothetical protein [Deltaproteobacteria bacterium]
MHVEHLDAALVRAVRERIAAARRRASEAQPEARGDADEPYYWQTVFEANAVAVLAALPRVRLAPGHVVRYRFYGRRGSDLLVRPFVTRAGADPSTILKLLDWHTPPDATTPSGAATQDVDLLYRHFTFEPTAAGVFEYWLAMQELWASQGWIHSTVLADAAELAALTGQPDWRVDRPVERVEPAVIRGLGDGQQLAVLVHCPLQRHAVTFHRVRIAADHSIEFAESLLVALGPRGLLS